MGKYDWLCGSLSTEGRTDLVIVSKKIDTKIYTHILEILLQYGGRGELKGIKVYKFIFQHDNASCHILKTTKKQWHNVKTIPLLD